MSWGIGHIFVLAWSWGSSYFDTLFGDLGWEIESEKSHSHLSVVAWFGDETNENWGSILLDRTDRVFNSYVLKCFVGRRQKGPGCGGIRPLIFLVRSSGYLVSRWSGGVGSREVRVLIYTFCLNLFVFFCLLPLV